MLKRRFTVSSSHPTKYSTKITENQYLSWRQRVQAQEELMNSKQRFAMPSSSKTKAIETPKQLVQQQKTASKQANSESTATRYVQSLKFEPQQQRHPKRRYTMPSNGLTRITCSGATQGSSNSSEQIMSWQQKFQPGYLLKRRCSVSTSNPITQNLHELRGNDSEQILIRSHGKLPEKVNVHQKKQCTNKRRYSVATSNPATSTLKDLIMSGRGVVNHKLLYQKQAQLKQKKSYQQEVHDLKTSLLSTDVHIVSKKCQSAASTGSKYLSLWEQKLAEQERNQKQNISKRSLSESSCVSSASRLSGSTAEIEENPSVLQKQDFLQQTLHTTPRQRSSSTSSGISTATNLSDLNEGCVSNEKGTLETKKCAQNPMSAKEVVPQQSLQEKVVCQQDQPFFKRSLTLSSITWNKAGSVLRYQHLGNRYPSLPQQSQRVEQQSVNIDDTFFNQNTYQRRRTQSNPVYSENVVGPRFRKATHSSDARNDGDLKSRSFLTSTMKTRYACSTLFNAPPTSALPAPPKHWLMNADGDVNEQIVIAQAPMHSRLQSYVNSFETNKLRMLLKL